VLCAQAGRKTTTVAVSTPAITPIGRAPMFTQSDVAVRPDRAGPLRVPELSAGSNLFGGLVQHHFSVIAGPLKFG